MQVATRFRLDFVWLTVDSLHMANAAKDAIAAMAMLTMCIRNETGVCAGQPEMTSSHGDRSRRENRPVRRCSGVEDALQRGRKASAIHAPPAPETVRI
ncbi:hypothetical protein [Paraburkholderia sp. 2C]